MFRAWQNISRPRGKLHSWLLAWSGWRLFIAFVLVWLLTAVPFAGAYQRLDVTPAPSTQQPLAAASFGDLFSYSLETQIIGNNGSLQARGVANWLSTAQAILGTTLIAVGFGLVVLKVTQRGHAFRFASRLRYTPIHGGGNAPRHLFEVWALNEDRYGLVDATATIGVEVPLTRYRLATQGVVTTVSPMQGLIFRTKPITESSPTSAMPAADPATKNSVHLLSKTTGGEYLFSPDKDLRGWRVRVEVRAGELETQRPVFFAHEYKMSDIFCGYWQRGDWGKPDWRDRPWKAFGTHIENEQAVCTKCALKTDCWLSKDVAPQPA